MVKTGKNFLNAKKAFEGKHDLSLDEAVNLVKDNASAKFDETVDIAINLGVDPKHADQMVRGVCALPHGNGKNMKVAVFAKGDKAGGATRRANDTNRNQQIPEPNQRSVQRPNRPIGEARNQARGPRGPNVGPAPEGAL